MIEYNNDFLNRLRDKTDKSPQIDMMRRKIHWHMHDTVYKNYKHFSFIDKANMLMASKTASVFNECIDNISLNFDYYDNKTKKLDKKRFTEDIIGCVVYFMELCFENDPEYYCSKINTKETRRDILMVLLNYLDKNSCFVPKEFCDILISHDDMIDIVMDKDHHLYHSREDFVKFISKIYGEEEADDLNLLLELEKFDK